MKKSQRIVEDLEIGGGDEPQWIFRSVKRYHISLSIDPWRSPERWVAVLPPAKWENEHCWSVVGEALIFDGPRWEDLMGAALIRDYSFQPCSAVGCFYRTGGLYEIQLKELVEKYLVGDMPYYSPLWLTSTWTERQWHGAPPVSGRSPFFQSTWKHSTDPILV